MSCSAERSYIRSWQKDAAQGGMEWFYGRFLVIFLCSFMFFCCEWGFHGAVLYGRMEFSSVLRCGLVYVLDDGG